MICRHIVQTSAIHIEGNFRHCVGDDAVVEELVTIAKCVGGRGLAAVCKLLAEDFSGWAGAPPTTKKLNACFGML